MSDELKKRPLQTIPADRSLLEMLYAHGDINQAGRLYGLRLLDVRQQWGYWLFRLLLVLGILLVLSGVFYFIAFNWARLSVLFKFAALQLGIVGCVAGAWRYSLQRLSGQLCLFAASMLVGGFLALFSQVYQTGADAYHLFLSWALLTLGWTLLSRFVVQWLCWLIIVEAAVFLWWQQVAIYLWHVKNIELLVTAPMALMVALGLVVRETGMVLIDQQRAAWFAATWVRFILVASLLVLLLCSTVYWIFESRTSSVWAIVALVGLITHGVAYTLYRYQWPDTWSFAAAVVSSSVIIECFLLRLVMGNGYGGPNAGDLFLVLILTVILFVAALIHLRHVTQTIKNGGTLLDGGNNGT